MTKERWEELKMAPTDMQKATTTEEEVNEGE